MVTLNGGSVTDNTASTDGGGIYNFGTVTLESGSIAANTASVEGGGIFDDTSNGAGTVGGNTTLVHGDTPDDFYPPLS